MVHGIIIISMLNSNSSATCLMSLTKNKILFTLHTCHNKCQKNYISCNFCTCKKISIDVENNNTAFIWIRLLASFDMSNFLQGKEETNLKKKKRHLKHVFTPHTHTHTHFQNLICNKTLNLISKNYRGNHHQ